MGKGLGMRLGWGIGENILCYNTKMNKHFMGLVVRPILLMPHLD